MRWYTLAVLLLLLPLVCAAKEKASGIITDIPTIGTPEQPTIDGGFIIHPAEKDTTTNKASEEMDQYSGNIAIPDEFSSDKAVKKLLMVAAHQHKLAYVLQRAEHLKLPATVALIPLIESHYQTDAVSPKGAKGAWQLMSETAKEYGLNNQKSLQFTASTDAALQLLKNLHQQFGNWTLAFAAYNAGSGRVLAALRQHPEAQCLYDLKLPLETNCYVDRLKQLQQTITHMASC